MDHKTLLAIFFSILPIVLAIGLIVWFVVLPRVRMAKRAQALLTQHPEAERKTLYLAFKSALPRGRRREFDDKIAEMAREGWTLLRAKEANPLLTIRSLGGGLTLEFIRVPSADAEAVNTV